MSEAPPNPNREPKMTETQKKCDEDTGHDFEWAAPEWDIGFSGHGECTLCGWMVPYEPCDLEDDYGC